MSTPRYSEEWHRDRVSTVGSGEGGDGGFGVGQALGGHPVDRVALDAHPGGWEMAGSAHFTPAGEETEFPTPVPG